MFGLITYSPDEQGSTSGGDTSSPDAGDSTSGDDTQSVELRRKVTEQSEEIKTLKTQHEQLMASLRSYPDVDRLENFLRTGQDSVDGANTNEGNGDSAESMIVRGLSEFDNDAVAKGVGLLREQIKEEVRAEIGGQVKNLTERTTDTIVRTFFVDRDAPEMAAAGSDFWKFVGKAASGGTPQGKAMNSLLQNDLDAGLEYAYDLFVREHGDPAAERKKRQGVSLRKRVVSEAGASLTPDIAPYIHESGGPKKRGLVELRKLMREKGAFGKGT